MESSALHKILCAYGLEGSRVSTLGGGSINEVWSVDAGGESFVLKRFTGTAMTPPRLEMVGLAEDTARRHGISVPETIPTLTGDACVLIDGVYCVLSRFVEGRTLRVGQASAGAARSMGQTLAELHEALSALPPGDPWVLPSRAWIEAHLRELLAIGADLRKANPVDEAGCRQLEHKLRLLSRLPAGPPSIEPGWTHRDYTVRNLLFNDQGEVAAVIDFDSLRFTSHAYEVMRCLAYSFPPWSEEGLAFFEAYATATRMTAAAARDCARLFCYVSTFSTWPQSARYLQESYQERWAEFMQLPEHPWDSDPEELAEYLAAVADSASQNEAQHQRRRRA